jgi:hypothetical protein
MESFEEFLSGLLREGRIVFRRSPDGGPGASEGAVGLLKRAYDDDRRNVAGPAIPFDAAVAREAGELVWVASWALVNRGDRVEELEPGMTMRRPPSRASDHASADLLLRYLPQVHRRARAIDPSDPLVAMLGGVLRQWPLSGVLADLDDGPATPPDLAGHPGLMLLYAERFAGRPRPAWQPGGPARDVVELVLQEMGRGGVGATGMEGRG